MQTADTKYNLAFALIIIAISLSLLFYLLPNDSLSSSDDVPKKVYFADNISKAHQKIIAGFNNKYEGQIEIVPISLPFSKFNTNDRKELLARSLRSSSSRIDLFAVDQIWVPRFTKWAELLSKYFSPSEISEILPYALSTSYFENTLVGIPLYIDIGIMYYRIDMLQKVPNYSELEQKLRNSITWREFIKLRDEFFPNQPYYMFQGDSYEGLVCNYLEVLGSRGGRLYEDGIFQIRNRKAIESGQLMFDLIHKYNLTPDIVTTFSENASYDYALKNDIPFFRGWPSSLKDMASVNYDSSKVKNLGMAALPHFEGYTPTSVFGGWNLMIFKHSRMKEEASLFIKYAISQEAQKILYETGGYLPILNELYEDESFIKRNPTLPFLRQLMDTGIHRPSHPKYTKISDIISYHINSALDEEISVEMALQNVSEAVASLGVSVE